ncbi:class I SAM-dependent methyltransferase [bacterium]|nr:class I SAM-dependent methyltransferase [bacterium]
MIVKKIKKIVKREQFHPGIFGISSNPFYIARKGLYREIRSLSYTVTGRVLDVGCGQKPYKDLFPCDEYVGLEIDTPENRIFKKADKFYDGKHIPLDDSSFDSIVTNQVFEHVFNPDEYLSEIYRVLKPGGTLLMTVPFVWDEHEQPYDFARYSSFGLKAVLERNGFQVIKQRKSVPDIRVIFQLINAYLYKITVSKNPYLNLFMTILLMAPFNILGELLAKILPQNMDLYLDNIALARKRIT